MKNVTKDIIEDPIERLLGTSDKAEQARIIAQLKQHAAASVVSLTLVYDPRKDSIELYGQSLPTRIVCKILDAAKERLLLEEGRSSALAELEKSEE